MKKKLVIGALVVILVVLGVIYWPNEGRAPEEPVISPVATSTTPASGTVSGAGNNVTVTNTIGWKSYTSPAYKIALSYPPDWTYGSENPIVLNNFKNTYVDGSIIPAGGAEVDVVATVANGSVDDIIKTELLGKTIMMSDTVNAAGVSCKEYYYSGEFAPNYPSKNIAVYCPGAKLLKIFLAYRAGDAKAAAFTATFKQILGTIKFVK